VKAIADEQLSRTSRAIADFETRLAEELGVAADARYVMLSRDVEAELERFSRQIEQMRAALSQGLGLSIPK
jgi:hypothetical protein